MNEVERTETRRNSQLLKDVVIALPDDKELNLDDRIEITHRIVKKMEWVKHGLGVQIDIHKPHRGDKNWHAHVLVTTRRFEKNGEKLGVKAVNSNPQFRTVNGKHYIIPESKMIHEKVKEVINEYFAELGLDNKVDQISTVPQMHVGPVRIRSFINEIANANELRKEAHLQIISDADEVLNHI
ncbi:mobA/MobL family protein, partial [Orientia chuto str. Dubai]